LNHLVTPPPFESYKLVVVKLDLVDMIRLTEMMRDFFKKKREATRYTSNVPDVFSSCVLHFCFIIYL
jgi:hypothetical protein